MYAMQTDGDREIAENTLCLPNFTGRGEKLPFKYVVHPRLRDHM